MLTQETKRKIDSARQILVGKVPDPKAQVEQITTALVYKFMDDMDKESEELGGEAKFFANGFSQYAWTKLLDNKLSGQERLDLYVQAITNMSKNPHIPQLFRDIFKGAFPTWLGLRLGLGEVAAMLIGFAAIIGHNWPVYLNFQGGRGFSPFLGVLLALFPWGVPIILAGLGIGNIFGSPAIPLIVLVSLPIFAAFLNSSSIVLWLSAGMTVITVVKRLEANRRPLPTDPVERRNVILRRIFLDRDIQDHKSWIRREPPQHN